jgi:hypothetical protein
MNICDSLFGFTSFVVEPRANSPEKALSHQGHFSQALIFSVEYSKHPSEVREDETKGLFDRKHTCSNESFMI